MLFAAIKPVPMQAEIEEELGEEEMDGVSYGSFGLLKNSDSFDSFCSCVGPH